MTNTGNCIPLSECLSSGGEARYQWFIHQSLIGTGGLITELAVRPITTLSFTAQDFEIRMSHTTQTAHSSTFATNLPVPVVVRRAAPISFAGVGTQWSPIRFDRAFDYDGNSNLTIEVRMRGLKASPGPTITYDSVSTTSGGAFVRTYALGAGTYATASTTASRTNVGGVLKIRLRIGDGVYNPADTPDTGTANNWPFNTYTAWRYQFIVNASVLPAAPMKITDIAFAPTATKSWTAKQFQVRMGHTTYKDFSTAPTPNCFDTMLGPAPVLVYDGVMRWDCVADTWCFLGLESSFGYDGTRNILVEIRYRGGPGSAGVSTRRDTSINRAYTHTGSTADPYNASCWIVPIPGQDAGAMHCLSVTKGNVLLAPDTVRLGRSATLQLLNGPARQFYQIAASLGQRPVMKVADWPVSLAVDSVFFNSVFLGAPVFYRYGGTTGSTGAATATLNVPVISPLVGVDIYHAAVFYSSAGKILGSTNTDGTSITR